MTEKLPEHQSSYRQIMKTTSLFGGVQIFNILISIIRSKFIAVLLGPAGMGISGLLSSTISLISGFTNFGLGTSAVKEVAAVNATDNEYRIAIIIKVLRRWVWITGSLGGVLTLALSPWLSELTFGNRDYTLAFIWLSITLLFQQITSGQLVVLQGMRKLQYLAKANLIGSATGLLISIPIYYFLGIDGIVPALICISITAMLLSWHFSGKVSIHSVKVSRIQTWVEGRDMLKMGFIISLTGLITLGVAYLVRIYISNKGGVAQVGLYTAGFAIINTYVGLVFNAMGTDYYPRLSGVAHDNAKAKETINQQAEISILILAPILMVFLVFINWVVILLYSTKFIEVNGMIHWAALGMFFKAASWSIAFMLLAKGNSKLFFANDLVGNVYTLLFNIIGYKLGGLDGLGISFLAGYFIYFIQVYLLAKTKYEFAFKKNFYELFAIQFFLGLLCFFIVKFMIAPFSYILGTLFIAVSILHALKEIDKRIGLKAIFLMLK
jgi:O-antigen/teichoic acid export membrane protein